MVGGGFAGICAAYLLSRGGLRVTLCERGRRLGGVMNGFEWNGFRLDLGCQLLDNKAPDAAKIFLDLLDGEIEPVDHAIASITKGRKTEGIEHPDLAAYGEQVCRSILCEIVEAAAQPEPSRAPNLRRRFEMRYGATAAGIVSEIVEDLFGVAAESLADEALFFTPFRRIRFLDDPQALLLKQIDVLDQRIIASNIYETGLEGVKSHVFYPRVGGMRGFFERASERIGELGTECVFESKVADLDVRDDGVRVTLDDDQAIEADRLFWSAGLTELAGLLDLPEAATLRETISPVPTVMFFFSITESQQGPYCYVHDFDPDDLIFRGSTPGAYGRETCPPGLSYACAELFTTLDSAVWAAPEALSGRVWDELLHHGVVTDGKPIDCLIKKSPVSNWRLPRPGFAESREAVKRRSAQLPRLRFSDDFVTSRAAMVASVKGALADFL